MANALIGKIESFVIPSGTDVSNAIGSKSGHNSQLMVYSKTTTDGILTYKYQASVDSTEWYDLLDSAGLALTPPAQGSAKELGQTTPYVRIKSSANVTAIRTWLVSAEL